MTHKWKAHENMSTWFGKRGVEQAKPFPNSLFHNSSLLMYSAICMIISLSDLFRMWKIQRNPYFQTRSERLIIKEYIKVKGHHFQRGLWESFLKQVRGICQEKQIWLEHSSGNHDHVPLFRTFHQNIFQQILGNFTEVFLTGDKPSGDKWHKEWQQSTTINLY